MYVAGDAWVPPLVSGLIDGCVLALTPFPAVLEGGWPCGALQLIL